MTRLQRAIASRDSLEKGTTIVIAAIGGMDFEHDKLLADWVAYHAGGKQCAA